MSSRTQLETKALETSNGTWYSVRNLSASGYNYFMIDLVGDVTYELSIASCQIATETYAHFGNLYVEWFDEIGDDHATHIAAGYFTNLDPFTLDRTVRFNGPCRLVFKTLLDDTNVAYFRCFVRTLGMSDTGW